MTYAFDTLGYAKRLRDAGVTSDQAAAHAEAARDFVMTELVTKSDLMTLETILRQEIATRSQQVAQEMSVRFLQADARFEKLEAAIENLTLRMTVRLGGMIAVAVAILAAINKL